MIRSFKIVTVMVIVVTVFVQNTNAQRPYFDKNKDLLMAQFDLKPDEDDVHSAAALGCMLQHSDFDGVNYCAVAGAYGTQNGTFVTEALPDLYNLLFGQEDVKWTNADQHWNTSVNWIKTKVKPVLNAGGKVFVQEAGQSDITYDWCKSLLDEGVSADIIKKNVVVVQHSNWNEDKTTVSKLEWVKANTNYYKIEDGNSSNATPGFNSKNTQWLNNAINITNPNVIARSYWTKAKQVCENYDASWDNPNIAAGGVDFSDCVENWWIFDLSDEVTNINSFWNKFVVNVDSNSTPTTQAPYGGSASIIPGTLEAEEFDDGGEGVAYHDTSAGNSGPGVMREDEDVDIESRNGDINVGWTVDGEWLEYTVNVTSGYYDIEVNVAAISAGKAIGFSLDGNDLGTVDCPNTGDWSTFETVKIERVKMDGGENQILRTTFVGGGVNVNWLRFTLVEEVETSLEPVTLSPLFDAYIQGGSVFNNSIVRIEADKRVGYLMYDLSGINGTITSAQLRLTCVEDNGNGTVNVYLGNGTDWTESTLSSSNAPDKGAVLASLNKSYAIGDVYVWDLDVSKFEAGGKLSLVLSQVDGNDFAVASKENSAQEPQLLISYSSLKSVDSVSTDEGKGVASEPSKPIVYPNPLNGTSLYINTHSNNKPVEVRVVDLTGKSVYQEITNKEKITIDAEVFSSGIYLIQIKNNQNVSTTKLLVNE